MLSPRSRSKPLSPSTQRGRNRAARRQSPPKSSCPGRAGQNSRRDARRGGHRDARRDLDRLGYDAVVTRQGDGYRGWPEQAPFDAIIVTAAPEAVPTALIEQLAVGGRMVVPVGKYAQELLLLRKGANGITREVLMPVRFVPMRSESE